MSRYQISQFSSITVLSVSSSTSPSLASPSSFSLTHQRRFHLSVLLARADTCCHLCFLHLLIRHSAHPPLQSKHPWNIIILWSCDISKLLNNSFKIQSRCEISNKQNPVTVEAAGLLVVDTIDKVETFNLLINQCFRGHNCSLYINCLQDLSCNIL